MEANPESSYPLVKVLPVAYCPCMVPLTPMLLTYRPQIDRPHILEAEQTLSPGLPPDLNDQAHPGWRPKDHVIFSMAKHA